MAKDDTGLVLNAPAKLQGKGLSGPKEKISRAEAKQRSIAMERLLAQGKSDLEIIEVMHRIYRMDDLAVKRAMIEACRRMAQEGAERKPYLRELARQRLYSYLPEAKADRRWGDIANIEKVLASIEGTNVDPREQVPHSEQRIHEATLRILNESDPKEIHAIIERERVFILKGKKDSEELINVTEGSKCLQTPK